MRQIRTRSLQIGKYHFQILAPKNPHQVILVPNLRIFIFAPTSGMRQTEDGHLNYNNSVSKLLPKSLKQGIFGSKF